MRHFEITHNKADDSFSFGVYTFYSFDELNHHFIQKPIGNEVGDGKLLLFFSEKMHSFKSKESIIGIDCFALYYSF